MDIDLLWLVLIVTPIVMAVIILVIGLLFFRALRKPTRDALAQRRAQQEAERLSGGRDSWTGADDDGGHPTPTDADADAPNGAGGEGGSASGARGGDGD
ncbi:hypothetical protein GCM10009792_24420 [Microcella alkalica]|uniref:Uncharacterized protein n=1 Tax=Microcella alkalica TaxID=355930 RepID=A0A839EA80_9MICO|nr:hypothetical protein [Microcella alkalica]MBA8848387.1 hypothetical protein [Microcella alkalica]